MTTLFNQLLDLLKFISPVFITVIITVWSVMTRLYDYSRSDFFIQRFYKSATIQLLDLVIKPIKIFFLNQLLTFIAISYLFLFKIVDFPKNLADIIKDKNQESLLSIFFIFAFCIGALQFLFYIFINSKNQHLKIRVSKLYINSTFLKEKYSFLPENIPVYISQNMGKNLLLCYYNIDEQLYRIAIPKSLLAEFPVQADEKESLYQEIKQTNELIMEKNSTIIVTFVIFLLILLLIFQFTRSLLVIAISLLQICFFLFPTIKYLFGIVKQKNFE